MTASEIWGLIIFIALLLHQTILLVLLFKMLKDEGYTL